ncbi:hypothetical protein GJAV_G00241420 [Gymnothorax javanicus]|nr:hypothetical protein GJAV_G00241420 [Gymnothorax javanicus]
MDTDPLKRALRPAGSCSVKQDQEPHPHEWGLFLNLPCECFCRRCPRRRRGFIWTAPAFDARLVRGPLEGNLTVTVSTKGASKVRRDEINREIQNMRQLLPIRPAERGRLSYLHSMAAICTFIRKSFFYPELQMEGSRLPLLCGDFLQALPGFIVALTGEGKLLYVSENVSDYLGFSMVDMLQWDSFYDMVDRVDVQTVRSHLESDRASGAGRAFVCALRCSKPFRLRQEGGACSMLVQGRFLTTPSDPGEVFIALCTPTVNRLPDDIAQGMMGNFQSKHALDMTFREASECVLFHLGYASEELIGQSWYGLLHPGDLSLGEAAHKRLLHCDDGVSVEMVLRLQCKDLSWVWLYVRAAKHAGTQGQEVTCTSYIISVTEASFLRKKTGADPPRILRSPIPITPRQGGGTSGGCKRQRQELRPQEEQWAKRAAIHAWDTPISPATLPVSPDSTHSEAQSPALKYNQTLEVPSCQPLPQISDSAHHPCGLNRTSPQTYIPACSMQLVPDFLSTPGPVYPDTFSHPACPSLRPVHSPTLLTPGPSPIEWSSNLYSQEETSILAQQISSLANSFPEYRSQNPTHNSAESTTHITAVNSNQHPRPTHSPVHDINRIQSPIHSLSSTLTFSCYLSPDYSLNSAHSPVHNLDPTLNPTRNQSPANTSLGQVMLFEPELILDDQVTEGILWHLDQAPPLPEPTPSCILPPPCGVGDQRAHGHVIFSTAQEDKLSPTMQPCTLKSGCHGNSTTFYHLSQCPCCTHLQGGLAEESMY